MAADPHVAFYVSTVRLPRPSHHHEASQEKIVGELRIGAESLTTALNKGSYLAQYINHPFFPGFFVCYIRCK